MKQCSKCKQWKDEDAFHRDKRLKGGRVSRCKECRSKVRRGEGQKKTREVKIKVMNAYGGKCACCGEGKIEFLTIDHINGSGAKHRRDTKINGGSNFYNWLIKNNYPEEFRVLCLNCNFSLGHYGYCPHQKKNVNFRDLRITTIKQSARYYKRVFSH